VGLLIAALLAAPCANAATGNGAIQWLPQRLNNGSPVLFSLGASTKIRSVTGNWLGHEFEFYRARGANTWFALAGVPLQTKPGIYELRIRERLIDGETTQLSKQVRVLQETYPRITVKVAKRFTEPNAAQLSAIAVDKTQKEKTFESVSPQRLWEGRFVSPVTAAVSDVFGTARVFNQEVQSRHQGLDYAVHAGTPVRAINSGTVVLAKPMYFEGNFIVLDHGQGLLSLYLHLSEFKVKEGDRVRTGEILGLSGGTGRATGAHLHLAIRWEGAYLDPAILLKLPIPLARP
jgi:murein DD-endopeptidase MepM/ murein hydrolase activator NlpD